MRHGKEAKQVQRSRPMRSRKALAVLVAASAMALVSSAAPASAAPAAPFTQCPSVGFDSSCAQLLVINAVGGVEMFSDPSQGSFAGGNAALIGVQNNSSAPVSSIHLKGQDLFGFIGYGVCSGNDESDEPGPGFTTPKGCSFGPTGYEGPDNTFSEYLEEDPEQNADSGTVNFTTPLEPGQTTYFSLEGIPFIACGESACEASSTATSLTAGTETGPTMEVPAGTPVSENATIGGTNGAVAGGYVNYKVYSDSGCTTLAAEAGEMPVTNGVAMSSEAVTASEGTYYWQASYGGDDHNAASQSACGVLVEKVVSPVCTTAAGKARTGLKKAKQSMTSKLTTLTSRKKPKFSFKSSAGVIKLTHLSTASCTVGINKRTFDITADASLKKPHEAAAGGYQLSAEITVRAGGATHLHLVLEKAAAVVQSYSDIVFSTTTQKIS